MGITSPTEPASGAADLRLPDALRSPLQEHIAYLRRRYHERGWGGAVGFGERPALVVIDLALGWTGGSSPMTSNLDSVVLAARQVLDAARQAHIPIFFTTGTHDPADPISPSAAKLPQASEAALPTQDANQLDPRLGHLPTEKIIRKPYASAFKGTPFHEMLTGLRVDTLIVTGCSTSHCVYATCRDAKDSFRVIVPREAVGERCELMHEVNLLDIEIDLADVLPVAEVVAKLANL